MPIGDACVSMRVCFDSLCFSSTQQRQLADEEDTDATPSPSPQLPTTVVAAVAAVTTAVSSIASTTVPQVTVPHVGVGGGVSLASMSTLRELQELLRVKEERIIELETALCRRDAEIQELRSHLDKFLSVLPFKSPLTPTKPRPRKQRAQGISAEPPLQELVPLRMVDKSDRLVHLPIYLSTHPLFFRLYYTRLSTRVHVCTPSPARVLFAYPRFSSPRGSLLLVAAPRRFPALKEIFLTRRDSAGLVSRR